MEIQYFEKEILNYDVCFNLAYSANRYQVGSGYYETEIENEHVSLISVYGELGEVTEGKILNEIEKEIMDTDWSDYIDLF